MNKILRSSMILMAGAMLFVACQKDGENLVDLTAVVSDQPTSNSKVYLDGNLGYWQHGDQVMINGANETYNKYTLSVQTDGSTTAKILNVVKDENDKYTAAYPASQVSAINNGTSVTMTIPQKQTYQLQTNVYEGTADSQHVEMPMVAYSKDGSSLKFYNAASLIRLNLVNNTEKDFQIHYVTVTADNSYISGTGTVSVAGLVANPQTLPSFSISENGDASVTLDCCDAHPLVENGKNIILYLVVAPFGSNESRDKLNVTVMAEDGDNKKYTFNVDSRASGLYIERGQIGAVKVTMTAGLGTQSEFWGQGTEACPYLITSKDDLGRLRDKTNAGTSGYIGNTVYYKQTEDIELSSWSTPIGNSSLKVFSANYDGGEYSITRMNYTCGLFSYAGGGSIKNLTVSGSVTLTSGQDFGGIVCKVTSEETLQACTNNVAISFSPGSNINLNAYGIGGCVGHATAKVTLNNCANENDIKITSSAETYSSLGGILGKNEGASSEIKNCTNNGIVGNTSVSSGSSGAFGGICGNTTAKVSIEGCENNGFMPWKPRNSSSYSGYLGGIIGKAESGVEVNIKTCTNNARLKSYEAQYCYFGGIIGYVASTAGTVSIEDCTNIGGISLPNVGSTYAGGMIAYMNAGGTLTIKNCTNGYKDNINDTSIYSQVSSAGMCAYSASATTIEACSNYSKIQSQTQGGGIIGRSITAGLTLKGHIINKGSIAATTTTAVTQCGGIAGYVEYKITVDENALVENYGTITGGDNLGGIVSRLSLSQDSYIRRCINYGTVTASASKSYGNSGLIGDIRCANSTNGITIQDCGNENNVSAAGMAGGIVGHIYSNGVVRCTIQNCYCDANLYGGTQTGGIFTTARNSSNALHIITSNCYYNGNLSGYSGRVGSLARITSTAPTTFKFSYCYADATSTPTPRSAEPTSGSSSTTYQAARTFTAPTGAYANKGASISAAEWSTDSTLLKVLNYRAESEGYASWAQSSHTEIDEETGDETVVIDKLPRLVLTTPTSKRRSHH